MQRENETDLLHAFIARVPVVLPDVRAFRRNVINAKTAFGRMRNGIKGQGDAYVLVRGGGHIEVEAKSATGSLRKEQRAWQAFCRAFAIPHLVVVERAGDPPTVTVERWITELRNVIEASK
jgi:chaperonin GroEL (HSP60 family)